MSKVAVANPSDAPPTVLPTEVANFSDKPFAVGSAVGGAPIGGICYGVRATLLGLTDEMALYTGSTWGQLVGGQSYSVSSALYCSVRPAEETSDVAYYRTTHVC